MMRFYCLAFDVLANAQFINPLVCRYKDDRPQMELLKADSGWIPKSACFVISFLLFLKRYTISPP